MFQVIQEVSKAMRMFVVEDELRQTVGHHRRGLSKVEGITREAQNTQGRKLDLEGRTAKGVGPGGVMTPPLHPHFIEYGGRSIEERPKVFEFARR